MIHHGAPCTSNHEPLICYTFRSYCISVSGDTFAQSLPQSTSCGCCLLRMYSSTDHISLPARSVDALGNATQSALSLPQSTVSSCEILPHNRPRLNRNVYSGACMATLRSWILLHIASSQEKITRVKIGTWPSQTKNREEVSTRSR